MGIEIERKFLLKNDAWRDLVYRTSHIAQAYLNTDFQFSTRVRLQSLKNGEIDILSETNTELVEANINVKSCDIGMSRHEYTYDIPINEAQEIFTQSPWQIHKRRHYIKHNNLIWEIDEFLEDNKGLIVAEVELESEQQKVELPTWCGRELTDDVRYYNHALSLKPYKQWVTAIEVNSSNQTLTAFNASHEEVASYRISTAKNGLGELKNSECTPRGLHQIRAKIGEDAPINSVFVSRRATGEIFTPQLAAKEPERDWILSRILWLSGLEKGKNRLGDVDTMQRYIYIHGCAEGLEDLNEPLGEPHSHGCIRMANADIIELFDRVFVGTTININ